VHAARHSTAQHRLLHKRTGADSDALLCALSARFSHCVSTQRGNPSCTFHTSGRVGVAQRWYRCLTCDFTDANHKGCCAPCASKCHVGHRLVDKGTQFGYCDCGAERLCDSEVGGTVCASAIFHRVPRDTTAEL
jgi:hypothetical protein